MRSLKTVGLLRDNRRARTAGGAYLELSAIANERAILQREVERWQRRSAEIHGRLDEMAQKEARLLAVTRRETPKHDAPAAAVNPQASEPKVRIKSRDISY
jgi:hypothetical protein